MNDQAGTLGSGNVVSAIKCQGDPVPVAVALLDRSWPLSLRLADAVGVNVAGRAALRGLEKDPRYLIGRFQQALTALLAADLPPMDALTSLLSAALTDAIGWRQQCPQCDESPCNKRQCDDCEADLAQVDRYHVLALALGAVAEPSAHRPGHVTSLTTRLP